MSDTTRPFTSLELGLVKSRSDCVNGDGSAIPLYSSVDAPPLGLPPLSVLLDEYGLSPRPHDEEHVMTVLRDALDKNEIGTEACQRNPLESAQQVALIMRAPYLGPRMLQMHSCTMLERLYTITVVPDPQQEIRRFYALINGLQSLAGETSGSISLSPYPATFLLLVLRRMMEAANAAVLDLVQLSVMTHALCWAHMPRRVVNLFLMNIGDNYHDTARVVYEYHKGIVLSRSPSTFPPKHGGARPDIIDTVVSDPTPKWVSRRPVLPASSGTVVATRQLTPLEHGLDKSRSDCVDGDGSTEPSSSSHDKSPIPPLAKFLDKYGLSPRPRDEHHAMSVLLDAPHDPGVEACERDPGKAAKRATAKILAPDPNASSKSRLKKGAGHVLIIRHFYALIDGVQNLSDDRHGSRVPPPLAQYPANFLLIVLRDATKAAQQSVFGLTHLPSRVVDLLLTDISENYHNTARVVYEYHEGVVLPHGPGTIPEEECCHPDWRQITKCLLRRADRSQGCNAEECTGCSMVTGCTCSRNVCNPLNTTCPQQRSGVGTTPTSTPPTSVLLSAPASEHGGVSHVDGVPQH